MTAITIERLLKGLDRAQAQFEEANEKFQENLKGDPVHAFEWAGTVMSLAAKASVYNSYASRIRTNQTFDTPSTAEELVAAIKDELNDLIVQGARNPRSSTSVCANYMTQQELAARAELLQDIRFW